KKDATDQYIANYIAYTAKYIKFYQLTVYSRLHKDSLSFKFFLDSQIPSSCHTRSSRPLSSRLLSSKFIHTSRPLLSAFPLSKLFLAKFESSTHRLTRSLSDSSIPQIEILDRQHDREGPVRRANSFDITEYYPHRWYYARMARRKARMETLKAAENPGLDDLPDGDATKPSIEILSLNGGSAEATLAGLEGHNVSGPLASLQEGVIGGIEVDPEQTVSNRLAEILQEKAEAEEKRRDLFLKARELHEEIQRVREKRREKWWQQFSHERKAGTQLEERQGALRSELDSLHRRIIGSLVKRQPLVTGVRDEPSRKANYKISIIRLRHEIEDISRRVEAMNIKVEAETKACLRSQAEREVKTLRSEVSRKKANVALSQTKTNLLKTATSLPPDLMIRMY
ncbi:uncharacterized protein LOC134781680, partial [Penaeus indicus]|uniref:uncharacterized protein LOC134781680 n=1 Tax=Penaeus indicus TaxID=29960 RepID=UPI00300C1962